MSLKENITITAEDAKNFLRVDHDEDDGLIQKMIDGAANTAEKFLNRDFDDDEDGVPDDIELWIMMRVARNYERRMEGLKAEGLSHQRTDWGEEDFSGLIPYRKTPGT